MMMLVVSAALMSSALVFGLYPQSKAEPTADRVPNQQATQDYEGKVGSTSHVAEQTYIAFR
jgi:hypothetical protein